MPRKALMAKDKERGERFVEVCRLLFPGLNRTELAKELGGVSAGTLRNWEAGQGISRTILSRLEGMGISLDYLLHGIGQPLSTLERKVTPDALSPAETLAANLRHLRRKRFHGWGGQRRFAEFLGISANDLCVYEYGRAIPNEQRLEDMARRLELAPEALLRLLPDAEPTPPPARAATDFSEARMAAMERSEREDKLQREVARLEAMNEVLRHQATAREERIRDLEAANLTLRSVIFMEDTPEGAERRRRLLESFEQSIAELIGKREVF